MTLKPISLRQMEEQTGDAYEAVVIISQRAKQILRDRMVARAMQESESEEYGVFDEVVEKNPDDFVEEEKATTIAVEEFLTGDLKWKYREEG